MRDEKTRSARLAAIWMLHGAACARLLRAHGREDQADNMDDALSEVQDILSDELGSEELSDALDWATAQLWESDNAEPTAPSSVH